MRAAMLGLVLSILLSWACPASAQPVVDESQRGASDTVRTTEWYGGGILLSDAATLVVWSVGASGEPSLAYLGLIPYLVVPQIIHGVHRNGSAVALSLVTRIGAPVVLAGLVGARGSCSDDDPETEDRCRQRALPRLLLAGGVGILTAMVLDAAVYARRPVQRPTAFTVVPRFDWSRSGGWSLGAQGRF